MVNFKNVLCSSRPAYQGHRYIYQPTRPIAGTSTNLVLPLTATHINLPLPITSTSDSTNLPLPITDTNTDPEYGVCAPTNINEPFMANAMIKAGFAEASNA